MEFFYVIILFFMDNILNIFLEIDIKSLLP